MRSSILIVIFDFFVCSLLLTVSLDRNPGKGRVFSSAMGGPPTPTARPSEFSDEVVAAEANDWLEEYTRVGEELLLNARAPGEVEIEEAEKKAADAEEERERAETEVAKLAKELESATSALADANAREQEFRKALEAAGQKETKLAGDIEEAEVEKETAIEEKMAAVERANLTEKEKRELLKSLENANRLADEARKREKETKRKLAGKDEEIADLRAQMASADPGAMPRGGRGGSDNGRPVGQSVLLDSRVEIKVGITEYDSFIRGRDDKFDTFFFPMTFTSQDQVYFIASAANFGLGWSGLSEGDAADIRRFEFSLAKRGPNAKSITYFEDLQPLSVNPHLVLGKVPSQIVSVAPLRIVGIQELRARPIEEGTIYKPNRSGDPMIVKFAADLEDSKYILLTSDPVTPKTAKDAPKPEMGDFLLTRDQRLVAIMIDEKRGLIVDPKILESTDGKIPLRNPGLFMKAAKRWEALQEEQ